MARILVIDDDAHLRDVLSQALQRADYEVVTTANGQEGLQLHRQAPFDLVVTDLVMPEKEGIETIIEFARNFPDVKIIAISGVQNTSLQAARHLGAHDTLRKPFPMQELIDAVRKLLLRS